MPFYLKQLLLLFCILLAASPSYAASKTDYQEALSSWSKVLTEFVDEQGKVDFIALEKQPEDLKQFVHFIARVSPSSHPSLFQSKQAVLAYHINAYNALAMWNVISTGIPSGFHYFIKRFWFFKSIKVFIGGDMTSLYDYENNVIRKLAEPRIHFALNCMVRDCPRLPRKVFVAETLEQDLTQLSQEFFNTQKHLYIDHEQKIVYVSEILDFYTEDFVASGKPQDLLAYINQFRPTAIPNDYQLEFIDYDWTINQQP